eukprot:5078534-Pleurochrysis_carterae.AAC.2
MKKYICVELRKMVNGFMAMNGHPPVAPGSFKLLSPQQLVQVNFYAPAEDSSAQTNAASSSSQASVRGTIGAV